MSDMQTWLGLVVFGVTVVGGLGTWMSRSMTRALDGLEARLLTEIRALREVTDVRLTALESDMQLVKQRILGSPAA